MKASATTRGAVIVATIALLAACAQRPAPVYDRSSNPYRKAAPTSTRIQRPSQYVVRRGDTLYSIAWRYGVDFRELARWNRIGAPYTIYPDQRLVLEAPRSVATTRPGPAQTRPAKVEPAPTSEPTPVPTRTQPVPAKARPEARAEAPTTPAASRSAGASGERRWRWPADGAVLSTYATRDPSRKGIDIAGDEGSLIRASAGGEVVYSGVGLIGYGELIIIKHDEQFLSAYAHNSKRLVVEGERVAAGQHIADMGSTGADRTKLHFEIRRDGAPVDPQRYLPER